MSEPTPTPPPDLGPEHERVRIDLAGYVLGGLTLAEQQAVEAHLATCGACRDELAELDPLPVFLDLARPVSSAASTAPTPPPLVDPHPGRPPATTPGTPAPPRDEPIDLTTEPSVGEPSARRRRRGALVGAAAAVLFVVALLAGVAIGRPDSPSFSAPIALQAADGSTATGSAALRATESGTVVRLDLHGLATDDGRYYECLWTSDQGTQTAGTFRPTADGSVQVDLVTAARRYPGWTLEIVQHAPDTGPAEPDDGGQVVLRAAA